MFALGLSVSVLSDLRQCVIEVFCSTSTDKSKKSSSLLLICKRAKCKDPPQIKAQPISQQNYQDPVLLDGIQLS